MPLTKKEIDKNKIDLLYQESLQKLNAFYIGATTGVLGFAGTFVWFPEKLFFGGAISFLVFGMFIYFIIVHRKEMKQILLQMDSLKAGLRN